MRITANNRNKLRIAVGSVGGARSTVWELFSTRSEFYILSRMMGRSCKISFHSSGHCQWGTHNNRDSPTGVSAFARKWKIKRPTGTEAFPVFRIIVPDSELHNISEDEDLKGVRFYPAPEERHALYFDVYLTGPMNEEEVDMNPPHDVVDTYKLADNRCVVVLWRHHPISDIDYEQLVRLKNSLREDSMNLSLAPCAKWRAVGFVPQEVSGVASFIECAPWSN